MSDLPLTRQSLLLELGRRSDEAWSEFLRVYESAIYRVCRSKGLQDADALDVTQEVLAAVHDRLPSWDPDGTTGSFRAWLVRVAKNISVDSIRERARRASASGELDADELFSTLPDRDSRTELDLELERSLFEWAADRVRAEVRDVTWQAFHRTAVQGRSATEVAAELGVPVGSVYTAKCRVVARIRERVSGFRDERTPGFETR